MAAFRNLPEAPMRSQPRQQMALVVEHLQLRREHPHSEVKDRQGQDDANAETHAPDGRQVVFTGSREHDEENSHCKGTAELVDPSVNRTMTKRRSTLPYVHSRQSS